MCNKILRYTGVNHNLIEFIKQVSVSSNINEKISINYITSSIGLVNIIKLNIANSDNRVIK